MDTICQSTENQQKIFNEKQDKYVQLIKCA